MTLIELLVVLVILAAVSTSIVAVGSRLDTETRYTDSVTRLADIRRGVLGPDVVAQNVGLLTGGYLQDVGWLPADDVDLLRRPTAVPSRTYSAKWKTWSGWGGPYLVAPPKRAADTLPELYDGWGFDFSGWPGGTPWTAPLVSGDFAVRSLGSNNTLDAGAETESAQLDVPHISQPLITESAWTTDLQHLQVRIVNLRSSAVGPETVRLRVVVPRWDQVDPLAHWPATAAARDAWEHLGGVPFTLNLAAAGSAGDEQIVTFGAGSSRRIPNGRRQLFLVDEDTGDEQILTGVGGPLIASGISTELPLSSQLTLPTELVLEIR